MLSAVAEYGEPYGWKDAFADFDTSNSDYQQQHSDHMRDIALKYFKPYLKVIDEGSSRSSYYLVLSNGVTLTFYPDGSLSDAGTFYQTKVYIIASLNNNHTRFIDESRDYSRKDFLMMFDVYDNGPRIKFQGTGSRDDIRDASNYGCNSNVPKYKRIYCAHMLYLDNWEIKDDYPW